MDLFIRSIINKVFRFKRMYFNLINLLVVWLNALYFLFFAVIENELLDPCPVALPQYCFCVTYTQISGEDVVFGLTTHYRLFMNSKEVRKLFAHLFNCCSQNQGCRKDFKLLMRDKFHPSNDLCKSRYIYIYGFINASILALNFQGKS